MQIPKMCSIIDITDPHMYQPYLATHMHNTNNSTQLCQGHTCFSWEPRYWRDNRNNSAQLRKVKVQIHDAGVK